MIPANLPDILSDDNTKKYLEAMGIIAAWKTSKCTYLGVNTCFLNVTGQHTEDEVLGKTDTALIWRDQADNFMRHDQEVMYEKRTKVYIESGVVI